MASPQTENGHTQIANEILEVIPFFKFNGTQLRMLLVIVRYTYGFKRKQHDLSVSFFEKATGITKRQIQKEINNLIENKVIIEISKPSFNTSRKLAFNKNYDEWLIGRSLSKEHSEQKGRGEQLDTSTGEQKNTSTGEQIDTQERKVKESIKEITTTTENPFVKFEKDICLLTSHQSQILVDWLENIFSEEVINEAITIACDKNKKNFAFVDYLLKDWKNHSKITLEQVKEYEQNKFKKPRINLRARKGKESFNLND